MSEVRLRIVNVTDVYKLDNFPSLKTLIQDKKKEVSEDPSDPASKTISILTGDFLAPYLLSSLDKGTGMINMLNTTPIDYVMFGNHEDDLEHKYVCQRIEDYKGVWLNTNMQSHEMFKKGKMKAFDIIELKSADGSNTRRVGLIAVLSDSSSLYRKNSFGGAKIEDPWETIAKYKPILEKEHNVDLIIPLCHLYEPQDEVTAEKFDFPVILSGHDHHTVDRVIHSSRLLKAGADAENAIVLDVKWSSPSDASPSIDAELVKVTDSPPDEELKEKVRVAYSILDHLLHTQLCPIPQEFRPLSSVGSRSKLCTAARFLWSRLRDELNSDDKVEHTVDCVLLNGGDLRGGTDYPDDSYFSLKHLKSEIQEQFHCVIVEMPGEVLSKGIVESHEQSNPGFIQIDDGVELDPKTGEVVSIGGEPLDKEQIYRVATSRWDIMDGASKTWINYFKEHTDLLPPSEAEWPVFATLISGFAMHVWTEIWKKIDTDMDGKICSEELASIDTDKDGRISKEELAQTMRSMGFEVDAKELGFIDCIMAVAGDKNQDGYLSVEELNDSPATKKKEKNKDKKKKDKSKSKDKNKDKSKEKEGGNKEQTQQS